MPSTYAHDRFGARVLERLPQTVRRVISVHRSLYDVGLQGPDILFHYKALSRNPVNELGRAMHKWSGKRFFGSFVDHASSDAAKAYLCGLLCHFTLDSVCHGTVNAIAERTGVHHFDVETELERTLMLADGKNPMRFHPTAHFVADAELGDVMASFFGISQREARAAVRGMARNIDLLVPRNALWRGVVGAALKAAHADTFYRLMIKPEVNAPLHEQMPLLIELGAQAEENVLQLINAFFAGTLMEEEQLLKDFANGKIVEE